MGPFCFVEFVSCYIYCPSRKVISDDEAFLLRQIFNTSYVATKHKGLNSILCIRVTVTVDVKYKIIPSKQQSCCVTILKSQHWYEVPLAFSQNLKLRRTCDLVQSTVYVVSQYPTRFYMEIISIVYYVNTRESIDFLLMHFGYLTFS